MPAHVAALDVLDDPAQQLVHAAVVDHDAVGEGRAQARPDRDDQRVVVQLRASLGVHDPPCRIDMGEAVGDHLRAGVAPRSVRPGGGAPAAARTARRRSSDGRRARRSGASNRTCDALAGELVERQRRLERRDATARDHDSECVLAGHRLETMADRALALSPGDLRAALPLCA